MAFTFDSNLQMENSTAGKLGVHFTTQLDLLDKSKQYLVPPSPGWIFMLSPHTNKTNQVYQLAVLSQHLQMCNYVYSE